MLLKPNMFHQSSQPLEVKCPISLVLLLGLQGAVACCVTPRMLPDRCILAPKMFHLLPVFTDIVTFSCSLASLGIPSGILLLVLPFPGELFSCFNIILLLNFSSSRSYFDPLYLFRSSDIILLLPHCLQSALRNLLSSCHLCTLSFPNLFPEIVPNFDHSHALTPLLSLPHLLYCGEKPRLLRQGEEKK